MYRNEIHYWISLPYATFMIISSNDIIIEAPPIAKWTIDKETKYVINYYTKKKAKIIQINKDKND